MPHSEEANLLLNLDWKKHKLTIPHYFPVRFDTCCSIFGQMWASVADVGPPLLQRWVSDDRLSSLTRIVYVFAAAPDTAANEREHIPTIPRALPGDLDPTHPRPFSDHGAWDCRISRAGRGTTGVPLWYKDAAALIPQWQTAAMTGPIGSA